MSNLPFLIGTLIWTTSFLCQADPPVAFPENDAAWTVTFTDSGKSSAQSAYLKMKHPVKIEVLQVNKVRRVVINWVDGTSSEQWAVPPLPVNFEETSSGTIDPNQVGSFSERAIKFSAPYDISAFGWVSPSTQIEKTPISYSDKQCLHYKGIDSAYPGGDVQTRECWIDIKTHLPVALDNGRSLAVFTFQSKAPTEVPVMPPKFKKEIEYYKVLMGFH